MSRKNILRMLCGGGTLCGEYDTSFYPSAYFKISGEKMPCAPVNFPEPLLDESIKCISLWFTEIGWLRKPNIGLRRYFLRAEKRLVPRSNPETPGSSV